LAGRRRRMMREEEEEEKEGEGREERRREEEGAFHPARGLIPPGAFVDRCYGDNSACSC
jgi:hypothetical protein